jgi:TolB protein
MRWISFSAAVLFCGLAFGAEEAGDRARLAADLLDAMNMETQVSQSFEAAKAAIPAQMKQMQSFLPAGPNGEKRGLPAEQTEKMMDRMLGMIATEMSWEKVKADYVTLYADTFSAAELAELIAFYRSPAGKAFVAKQPELTRKSIAMSQKSMLRLMPKIIAMTAASARKAAPPVPPAEQESVGEAAPAADLPAQPVVPDPAKESGVSAVFRTNKPEMLMLLSHDGKHVRPLTDVPSHPTIGSPALSPAGDLIACDGNRPGTSYEGTELLVMKADGIDVECLGNGAMPSWAADGKRLAFSCAAPRGVWVLDLATKKRELIDKGGWGIQWSPDGKYWAYSRRGALVVKNAATGEVHEQDSHLGDNQVFWGQNMAWSPDGRALCGVVRLRNNQSAVVVQSLDLPQAEAPPVAAKAQGVDRLDRGGMQLFAVGQDINRDVAWHPSGQRIVFTTFSAATSRFQMFEFDPTKDSLPSLVAGQTATSNFDQCWSADGKTLVYVAEFPVEKTEPQ